MKYIKLDNLDRLCKGDKNKRIKYLEQYLELIPSSVTRIELAMKQQDKTALAKEIHYIKPQLMFFGMEDSSLTNAQNKTNNDYLPIISSLLVHIKK